MTQQHDVDTSDDVTTGTDGNIEDDSPENLPTSAWITLVGFAAFVVLFGTCAANWMFN